MHRSFTTACALGALLVAGPALAQSQSADQPSTAQETMQALPPAPEGQTMQQGQTTPPPRTGDQPMQAQDAQPAETMEVEVETVEAQPAGDAELQGGFIARQGTNQLMASELMDADVMTVADESLGAVEDMILDAEGRVTGVVVGVGGFLGIGEKQVAIPTESLQVVYEGEAEAAADAGGERPMQVGQGLAAMGGTDIAHVLVDFSREELEQAPEFARLDEQGALQAEGQPPAEEQPVEATGTTSAPATTEETVPQPQ